jgi:hypothetical protein
MNAIVSEDSVRLLLQSFPYALSRPGDAIADTIANTVKSEELRAWCVPNPGSI